MVFKLLTAFESVFIDVEVSPDLEIDVLTMLLSTTELLLMFPVFETVDAVLVSVLTEVIELSELRVEIVELFIIETVLLILIIMIVPSL
jgi:hypothetical protein